MFEPVSKKEVAGIAAGAVGGVLLQGAAITTIIGAPYFALITTWGRYGVAIALVALFCVFYKTMSRALAFCASIVCGTAIPTILAKFVFGGGSSWLSVLGFNLLFSAIALVIFLRIAKR